MPQKKISRNLIIRNAKKKGIKKTSLTKTGAKHGTSKKASDANVNEDKLSLQALRGMRDILPEDQPYWERVRRVLTHASQEYGFQRIDTPLVEYANLFTRLIGTGTDIVEKEMYTFVTRGGDKVALRPEFTAGIARAYIQHGMNILPKPVKLFSIGPVYRYDRPQEGRFREFWQGNFELYGESDPILDAQTIQLAYRVVQQLGLKNIEFQVNSIGVPESRREYEKALVRYLEAQKSKLCQNCRERLTTNPMRILDCKEDKCIQLTAQVPQSIDYLDQESRDHFKRLLEYLDELELPYTINTRLVRGLDYYTKTVFEIWSNDKDGKKYSLGGGGRYDRLIQMMGAEATPAIGFGLGLDRIILEMKHTQVKPYQEPRARVFLAQLGDMAKKKSLKLFSELERNSLLVAESFGRGSLRSQMRVANRMGAEVTIIIGQKEALDDTAIVKDMVSGTQETVTHERLADAIKKILKTNQELKIKEVNIIRPAEEFEKGE